MSNRPQDVAADDQILALLPYAHMRGGFVIKPEDMGRAKGLAIEAMEGQVNGQLKQIYDQVATLAKQAKAIRTRAEVSYKIYQCDLRFEPRINQTYHLYDSEDGKPQLSLIAPDEWTTDKTHLATVRLLADHTWEVVESSDGSMPDPVPAAPGDDAGN
ncbi:MAG: hypothetical protein B9S33_08370 [Pedosphaera sp. Tous-C6FEB]|nr:MAG: hypothetical protein B9S33_08370 [Pedosphaera sp. Tous-C6FEB]